MDGIAEHLKIPSPLQLGVYGLATISSTQESLFPTFSSEFLVEFRKNGSVKKLSLMQQSFAPAVDEAIASAIYKADSTGLFPPIAEATNDSELKVFIDFDMTDVVSPGIIADNRYPLFRATVPVYPATQQATPLETNPVPAYPERFRSQLVEGDVLLKFVVDSAGKIAADSYRFTEVSEEEFGQAVLRILPALRYQPARIGNCPVKQLLWQSFGFKPAR